MKNASESRLIVAARSVFITGGWIVVDGKERPNGVVEDEVDLS